MQCKAPEQYTPFSQKKTLEFDSNIKDLDPLAQMQTAEKPNMDSDSQSNCAQNLNEEFFTRQDRKVFESDVEQSELELDSHNRDLEMSLNHSTKKEIQTQFKTVSPENRAISILKDQIQNQSIITCLLYTSPSPRDSWASRMPSSAWKKKK